MDMNHQNANMQKLASALDAMPVSQLSYDDWVRVGMALKQEGCSWQVWDEWSRPDGRYVPGECEKKWNSFRQNRRPVTAASIYRLAQEWGWRPPRPAYWDEPIPMDATLPAENDVDAWLATPLRTVAPAAALSAPALPALPAPAAALSAPALPLPVPDDWNPTQDLLHYFRCLYAPTDILGYVTSDVHPKPDGRFAPGYGSYTRTAGELIAALESGLSPAQVFGSPNPAAGAWIHLNPLDGKGIRDENVSAFRYGLVECDTLPLEEQYAFLASSGLPIATLTHSGSRSLHALVRVDAPDAQEYRSRMDFLYQLLKHWGFPVDVQNRNPSRLTRLPGFTRNDKPQYLLCVNLGPASWSAWQQQLAEASAAQQTSAAVPASAAPQASTAVPASAAQQTSAAVPASAAPQANAAFHAASAGPAFSPVLPPIVNLEYYRNGLPPLPEPLIEGILRIGHKMLLSGPSKAGKSFLLMELCIAIAEGKKWLGFSCRQGRVLYINLEIDPASCIHRFFQIYGALHLPGDHFQDIHIWNWRGHALPMDQLTPYIVAQAQQAHYDAIVIDPIYKVLQGDENSASDMGAFCNQFDKICDATGCATIYCHHHSKGAQGMKKAMDRASGSGVFARDPDAQLDMIQLELTDVQKLTLAEPGTTAWRLESSLREFPNIAPVNFWFSHPIHLVDAEGQLSESPMEGTAEAAKVKSGKLTTPKERLENLNLAYNTLSMTDEPVLVTDIENFLEIKHRSLQNWIREFSNVFKIEENIVKRVIPEEASATEAAPAAAAKTVKGENSKAVRESAVCESRKKPQKSSEASAQAEKMHKQTTSKAKMQRTAKAPRKPGRRATDHALPKADQIRQEQKRMNTRPKPLQRRNP